MKLCLNLEADRINVLALNMGRIAVEVDGIELAELIDVVCDNGYSLRVVDESDKQAAESTLPPFTSLSGMCCSTAHITGEDNAILDQASLQQHDGGDSDWILYTVYRLRIFAPAQCPPVPRAGAETDGNVKSLSPVSGDADTPLCHWYSPPGCFWRTSARF